MVDGLVKGDRILNGVHGVGDGLLGQIQRFGDLRDLRLSGVFVDEGFLGPKRLVGDISEGTADPEGVVVSQIAAHLADDHRYGVGGKAHVLAEIEMIRGLDQTDAAHLKEIVGVFAAARETLNDAEDEAQIAVDDGFSGLLIAALRPGEELPHDLIAQNRQF